MGNLQGRHYYQGNRIFGATKLTIEFLCGSLEIVGNIEKSIQNVISILLADKSLENRKRICFHFQFSYNHQLLIDKSMTYLHFIYIFFPTVLTHFTPLYS